VMVAVGVWRNSGGLLSMSGDLSFELGTM
jgi:hypothetical protein